MRRRTIPDDQRTRELRREAFRAEWSSGEWETRVKADIRAEWERHFDGLGLNLSQFSGSVLDVGCGITGAIYFTPNARWRLGVDPAAKAFGKWNREDDRGRHRIDLIEAEAEKLPIADASMDSVFCINCLDHTSDPAGIVGEIHRVLKPKGRIVMEFDIDSPLRRLHKLLRPLCALMHPHSLDFAWVQRTFMDSGKFRIERTHRDPEAFRGLPAKLYEAYWDDLLFRLTGSNRFINHLWLTGTRA